MINLLPAQELEDIVYARRNTRLLHWIIVLLIGLAGIVAMVGAGRFIIDRSADRVEKQVISGKQLLESQKVGEVQGRVEEISASLKLATQVLSRQVILSELIQQIAKVLPSGSALSGLQLSKIEGGMDLSVNVTDYQVATQVQINLKDPKNKLFEQADINTISCVGGTDPRYPCQASFRVLFAEDNPYIFMTEDVKP